MKIHRALILGVLLVVAGAGLPGAGQEAPLTVPERTLADLVNLVRLENGRPPVEITSSLTKVARLHIGDLKTNHPDTGEDARGEDFNMHSWSNRGAWNPVCYTDDHAYANLMWSKPGELTSYTATGYEIVHFYGLGATPEQEEFFYESLPHSRPDQEMGLGPAS